MTAHRDWLRLGLLCLLATTASAGSPAQAETYPAAPVKFITQLSAGSGTDPAMRIVIDQLGRIWGQQTVLINQPGAGGAIAARAAATAAPDGHTLYMAVASTFTVLPEIQSNLPFHVNDFVPIGFVGEVPIGIAVSPTFSVNSLPELVSISKRQARGLSIAAGPRGQLPHLTTELFRSRSGGRFHRGFLPRRRAGDERCDQRQGPSDHRRPRRPGRRRTAQAACNHINCAVGVASWCPDRLRNAARIRRFGMVCPRCPARHPRRDRGKGEPRLAYSPCPRGCQTETGRAQRFNACNVTAGARRFHQQRKAIVDAGNQTDWCRDAVALPR
jgi:hypothetical protein